jgi:hypothetical protein
MAGGSTLRCCATANRGVGASQSENEVSEKDELPKRSGNCGSMQPVLRIACPSERFIHPMSPDPASGALR